MSPRPLGVKLLVVLGAAAVLFSLLVFVLIDGGQSFVFSPFASSLVMLAGILLLLILWGVWKLQRLALWAGHLAIVMLTAVFAINFLLQYGLQTAGLALLAFLSGYPGWWLAYFARPSIRSKFT